MKLRLSFAMLVMLFCLGFSLSAAAQVPETMTYDGNLTDGSGAPVNTTVEATFRLYDASDEGTEVWSETFSTIDVVEGSFSAQLGQTESLVDVFDGSAYWLEVSIDGETLSPRNPVESVPYALRSNKANEADSLQGLSAADVQAALDELASLRSRVESLESNLQGSGDTPIDIASLESRIGQNEANIATNTAAISTNTAAITANVSDIATNTAAIATNTSEIASNTTVLAANASDIFANTTNISANATLINAHQTDISALQTLTQDMQRTTIGGQPSVTFTGVNLHVRNGLDVTNGDTGSGAQVNGLGNLIVGYDEARASASDKSGSHNIVVGTQHNYGSYGGLVVGFRNAINGRYAAVSGGTESTASGDFSSVGGGRNGTASGDFSAVSGGSNNNATNSFASVSGGSNNNATSLYASVSGGLENSAQGNYASVSGGNSNTASNFYATVSGGAFNTASAGNASVSGGFRNRASGGYSTVSGGFQNTASGADSTVSGGSNRSVSGSSDWRAGSLFETQ